MDLVGWRQAKRQSCEMVQTVTLPFSPRPNQLRARHTTLLQEGLHMPHRSQRGVPVAAWGPRSAGAGGVGGASRAGEPSRPNTGSRTCSATGLLRVFPTYDSTG